MKRITFLALFAFAASLRAIACSCAPPPPVSVALAGSDFVIFGRCISFSVASERHRLAKIEIIRRFKGNTDANVIEIHTGISESLCGFDFIAGEHYLIYGGITEGIWRTGLCTRNRGLAESWASNDREYIALDMMMSLPSERWKEFDGDASDPFSSPGRKR